MSFKVGDKVKVIKDPLNYGISSHRKGDLVVINALPVLGDNWYTVTGGVFIPGAALELVEQQPKLTPEMLHMKWIECKSPEHSTKIQRMLFSIGVHWLADRSGVKMTTTKFLHVKDSVLMCSSDKCEELGYTGFDINPYLDTQQPAIGITTASCKHSRKRPNYVMIMGKKVDFNFCPDCQQEVV